MAETANVTIFDNINSELRRRHLNQDDLATYLNVERKTYTNWQKKNDMPMSKFQQTAAWFGCTLDYLVRDVKS